jgi:predicted porin
MKKTLLALAVPALLAAGSASAADVYNQDGVIVSIGGAAEVQLFDGYEKDKDADIRLDDGELNFGTLVTVNDQLSAIGFFDFEVESGEVKNDELYAGLVTTNAGTITFGRQYLIADDAGIGEDYELAGESFGFTETHSDRAIKYTYDNGQYYAGISHSLDANDTGSITDGRIGARFGGVDVRAYVYTSSDFGGDDDTGYNLEAVYGQNNWSVAGSFGNVETEEASSGKTTLDVDAYAISGTYTMNATTFAGGFNYYDESESDIQWSTIYANATQQLHNNVKAYAEIGYTDGDGKKTVDGVAKDVNDTIEQFAYVVGLEVSF